MVQGPGTMMGEIKEARAEIDRLKEQNERLKEKIAAQAQQKPAKAKPTADAEPLMT